MSSGDKMAPFLALEMAWVCHVIFLSNATFIKTILYHFKDQNWDFLEQSKGQNHIIACHWDVFNTFHAKLLFLEGSCILTDTKFMECTNTNHQYFWISENGRVRSMIWDIFWFCLLANRIDYRIDYNGL